MRVGKMDASGRAKSTTIGRATVAMQDALSAYPDWSRPTAIIADGPYGLGKFPGEPDSVDQLADWYEPHVAAWSKAALPETTLWFWCSEVGWAEVHAVLKRHGWKYKAAHIWNKGIGHVAGNCNGETIRGFPVVTEICVQYVRDSVLVSAAGTAEAMKVWLRSEWKRSGLPLQQTNAACGVANAATRKYFTQCKLWYFPPPDKMKQLADYATRFGAKTNRPYFSLDGKTPFSEHAWSKLRAKWNHAHGVTNVWDEPAMRGVERIRSVGIKPLHMNQKPLKLIERIILASTDEGDVVWEPFGGLFSASIAASRLGRISFGTEINPDFYHVGVTRLREEHHVEGSVDASIRPRNTRAGSRAKGAA